MFACDPLDIRGARQRRFDKRSDRGRGAYVSDGSRIAGWFGNVEPSQSARELAREVLIHGPISRGELSKRLGLSAASLTRLSRPLLDSGYFMEVPERGGGLVGRPVRPLDVRADGGRFAGIKLTGDIASAVITDLRARRLASVEVPILDHDVTVVIDAIVDAVDRLGGPAGLSGLGISLGGNVTGNGRVLRAPFLGWRDVDLAPLVSDRLGVPVVLDNDVLALAAAEHWFGAGRGVDDFAVLTVGAGVGYALVMNDRVVNTRDAGLGLAGHVPLDPAGPPCSEGHRGCSSAMLTMPQIESQVSAGLGRATSYDAVLRLAESGDDVASRVLRGSGRALGRLIAAIANLTMVNLVVLSGEGVGMVDLVWPDVLEGVAMDRDPEASDVRLAVQSAGYSQWARGAAAVAIQRSLLPA
jgi:predicted NBD/HSP70 family sugar kinase